MTDGDVRRGTNPLFNANKLKLGTFATNVSYGCAISTVDGSFQTNWADAVKLAQIADEAGLEAIVPVARWRGFGGITDFNGSAFDPYTWAAGLAMATNYSSIFATSHIPTMHPIVAAKQAATIDHISNGRFALNIVCGSHRREMDMFGELPMRYENRYEYAAEWTNVIKTLWMRTESWDYEGAFFKINKGFSEPKPIQKPYPALMNAGGSESGRDFAARECDIAFILVSDFSDDAMRREIDKIRNIARRA